MRRSLRVHLLRRLLPPVAALLGLGALIAYLPAKQPATEAYDLALVDIGLALGDRIRSAGGRRYFDLPGAVDKVLRTDKYDTIYYRVLAPDGSALAGDPDLPTAPAEEKPRDGVVAFDGDYRGQKVRMVTMQVPCDGEVCTVQVAETTIKRQRLIRTILLSSLIPELLIAVVALVIVWFGVKQGLSPLARLSDEIKARSPRDLRPIDADQAPEEARPLVGALNQLLEQVAEANRNQQRFLANAAHQLRTPLAGLQAHCELALAQPVPEACRTELEQVHGATVRTARLANQLLALARAEPGGYRPEALNDVDLKQLVEDSANEWVHRALAKDIDLGFHLAPARVRGDAFLLREAIANLVSNAIEYTPGGGRVTMRTGTRSSDGGQPFVEIDDDGPGIPPAERERVQERFYRMPGAAGVGSGLGLAIVREIAFGHGIQLRIGDGESGRGCQVALVFAEGVK